MLAPRKIKRRKQFRPDIKGKASQSNRIAFGAFALKAITGGWVKTKQLEAARRVMAHFTRRGGKIWIRVFPHQPITNKGSQSTMGGGKGAPEYYVALIKPGMILFEMDGVNKKEAEEAITLASYKLPIKGKFVCKN